MSFKIRSFNTSTGQIGVEFTGTNTVVAIDVPVIGDEYITGRLLEQHINTFKPLPRIDRVGQVQGVVNVAAIESLVEPFVPLIETKIEDALAFVNMRMDQALNSPIECNERVYNADAKSRLNILEKLAAVQNTTEEYFDWRLHDNTFAQINGIVLQSVSASISERNRGIYEKYWTVKDLIRLSTTEQQIADAIAMLELTTIDRTDG